MEAQVAALARTRGISEEAAVADVMLAPMPKGTFVTCEEVAAAASYLIGPLARNVTGQALAIDGGWTAQ